MRELLVVPLALAVGCTPLRVERRVEPGPVLDTSERRTVLGAGGVELQAEAQWPELTLRFVSFEVCRREQVARVAEQVVEERAAPEAGPALSLGIAGTLAGGALAGLSLVLPAAPQRRVIDEAGRYGPSDAQLARGWGLGLLAVGVPALVTGLIGVARSGESSSTRVVEQVLSSREERCNRTPRGGAVALLGEGAAPVTFPAPEGRLSLTAAQLAGQPLEGVLLDGQPLVPAEGAAALLEAFGACVALLSAPEVDGPPASLPSPRQEELLRQRLLRAEACRRVPGAPVSEAVRRTEQALALQEEARARQAAAAVRPVAELSHPEDVRAFTSSPLAEPGVVVRVQGRVLQAARDGVLVLDVGGVPVHVHLEGPEALRDSPAVGSQVLVLGAVAPSGPAAPLTLRALRLGATPRP